ncbi:hypothetical protein FLX56_17305 [Synechococcus moorigangaii CMS01]|nr:hypothetical protein [Synechococcus moorigangaii CMS01]
MVFHQWLDRIGDWNPQLFRELKGRFSKKNLGLVAIAALLFQGIILLSFWTALPLDQENPITNYYCIGRPPVNLDPNSYPAPGHDLCVLDAAGQFVINWPLWWTDVFIHLSMVGFLGALLGGVYLLIQDLGKEEKTGTLNFVRLSPQSAQTIALGKILGVPSLIYVGLGLVLPLHFWAAIQGGISLPLLLLTYGVIIASYGFFYSGATLYSLVNPAQPALKAWLATGGLFYVMSGSTAFLLQENNHVGNLVDGIHLFNPLHMLVYLGQSSTAADRLEMFNYDSLTDVSFFRVYFWQHGAIASVIYLLLYGVGIFWFQLALRRKFHAPNRPLLSKKQSYILTALLTIFGLGFTVQPPLGAIANHNDWLFNFLFLAFISSGYLLALMTVLSPPFQTIQDWSRYQQGQWQDWLFGEQSPAIGAIMVNTTIAMGAIALGTLSLITVPYKITFTLGIIMQGLIVILLSFIAQKMLLRQHKRRGRDAAILVGSCIIIPFVFLGMNGIDPELQSFPWFWTLLPTVATENAHLGMVGLTMLAQLSFIVGLNYLVQRRLKQLGRSELQQLLSPAN